MISAQDGAGVINWADATEANEANSRPTIAGRDRNDMGSISPRFVVITFDTPNVSCTMLAPPLGVELSIGARWRSLQKNLRRYGVGFQVSTAPASCATNRRPNHTDCA